MHQHVLELEVLFEVHSVCSGTITHFVDLERVFYDQRALAQPLLTVRQLGTRQKRVQLLTWSQHLCLPSSHQWICTLNPRPDPNWSNRDSGIIGFDDLLALAAAVYIYIKLHSSPEQRYPHGLSELLAAFAALLVRR